MPCAARGGPRRPPSRRVGTMGGTLHPLNVLHMAHWALWLLWSELLALLAPQRSALPERVAARTDKVRTRCVGDARAC